MGPLRTLLLLAGVCASRARTAWETVQAELRSADNDGWTLVAGRGGAGTLLSHVGAQSTALEAPLPVASASKWVSSSVILRLVQEGVLSLDDTVQRWLPTWGVGSTDGRAELRLSHLLSFTSGMADQRTPCDWGDGSGVDALAPLAQCVLSIAAAQPKLVSSPPGAVFTYNGFNLEVAGAMVEAASNKSWATLFAESVQAKLRAPARFTVSNSSFGPLEGLLLISAADYARFLTLVLPPNVQHLNESTQRMVYSPQWTAQARLNGTLTSAMPVSGYGLGRWLEENGTVASSLGITGVYPRANLSTGAFAVLVPGALMAQQRNPAAVAAGAISNSSVALMLRIWAPLMQALAEASPPALQDDTAPASDAQRVAELVQSQELRAFGGACDAALRDGSNVDVTVHGDFARFVLSKPAVDPNGTTSIHAFADALFADVPKSIVQLLTSITAGYDSAFRLAADSSPRIWLKLKRAAAVTGALGCRLDSGEAAVSSADVNAALLDGQDEERIKLLPDQRTQLGPEWLGAVVTVARAQNGSLLVRCASGVTPMEGLSPALGGNVYLKTLSPAAVQRLQQGGAPALA